MIVPTLNLEVMAVCSFIVFLLLSLIWNRSDLPNLVLKVVFIVMTIWTGMNSVALIWFQGV